MDTSQFLAWLISTPVVVVILNYLKDAIAAWWKKRADEQRQELETSVQLRQIDEMSRLNVSNIKRDDFQTIVESYSKIASAAVAQMETEKANSAKAMDLLHNAINDLERKFEPIEQDRDDCASIRTQLEQQFRMFCDTFNVAFWAIDPDGHLEGNFTFFEVLTGLDSAKCHNDGWFEAIDEAERESVVHKWQTFCSNYATKPTFNFTFKNQKTGKSFKTKVFCFPLMRDGMQVYKFTAQTAPLVIGEN